VLPARAGDLPGASRWAPRIAPVPSALRAAESGSGCLTSLACGIALSIPPGTECGSDLFDKAEALRRGKDEQRFERRAMLDPFLLAGLVLHGVPGWTRRGEALGRPVSARSSTDGDEHHAVPSVSLQPSARIRAGNWDRRRSTLGKAAVCRRKPSMGTMKPATLYSPCPRPCHRGPGGRCDATRGASAHPERAGLEWCRFMCVTLSVLGLLRFTG